MGCVSRWFGLDYTSGILMADARWPGNVCGRCVPIQHRNQGRDHGNCFWNWLVDNFVGISIQGPGLADSPIGVSPCTRTINKERRRDIGSVCWCEILENFGMICCIYEVSRGILMYGRSMRRSATFYCSDVGMLLKIDASFFDANESILNISIIPINETIDFM